jgi:hypothetical protein
LLSQKLLEHVGCVDKRPLAAIAQDGRHEKFPVSRINTKFDDVVAPERDAVGFHEADIRIVSASYFHGLQIASVVLVLFVQAVQFEIWSNCAIGPERTGAIFGAVDLPGDKRPTGIALVALFAARPALAGSTGATALSLFAHKLPPVAGTDSGIITTRDPRGAVGYDNV